MKLKWTKQQSNLYTTESKSNQLEYRIEIVRGIRGYEIYPHVSNKSVGRNLGWCPNIIIAKKRCQDMENYFSNHDIILW